jgi:tRNA G10  N-methylase Trm11
MDAQLLIRIVDTYTRSGETILDPMAGSGTTMLACLLGRNVILVELEEKYCQMMRDNWEKVTTKPQLVCEIADCQIIQGDARWLEGLLVDKIVTSPPYTNRMDGGIRGSRAGMTPYTDESPDTWFTQRDQRNIGNLPYGNIDSIITSPPYEHQIHGGTTLKSLSDNPSEVGQLMLEGYSKAEDNIGNLKSQSYLEAMLAVYRECYKVLKPEGLMILVTKDYIRNKKRVDLAGDTIKLCEEAGFRFVERHYRMLPSQSFWRRLYRQKFPEVEEIKHEDILVLTNGDKEEFNEL